MIIAIFGALGSMGRRHIHNLTTLRPDATVIAIDPLLDPVPWREMPFDAAIIASPYPTHLRIMVDLCYMRVPFYVEKPPVERGHLGDFANIVEVTTVHDMRCAVGFQYRWHPRLHLDNWRRYRHIKFYAQDDLLDRYGATCLETMTSHPLDTALQIRGNPKSVDMVTDGIYTAGALFYHNGEAIEFSLHMDRVPRVSQIHGGRELVSLDPDDTMYINALRGWLDWLDGGKRDWRTATLEDGFEVMRIMEQVKHIQKENT